MHWDIILVYLAFKNDLSVGRWQQDELVIALLLLLMYFIKKLKYLFAYVYITLAT